LSLRPRYLVWPLFIRISFQTPCTAEALCTGPGVLPFGRYPPNRICTRKHPDLPSSRVTPLSTCPGLRPRWCPVHSPYRVQDCCLPLTSQRRLSPSKSKGLSYRSTTIHFSGLNTEPALLIHPASNSRFRVGLWISLPACWLGFGRVGFPRSSGVTHWVTSTSFLPLARNSQGLGFVLAQSLHFRHLLPGT